MVQYNLHLKRCTWAERLPIHVITYQYMYMYMHLSLSTLLYSIIRPSHCQQCFDKYAVQPEQTAFKTNGAFKTTAY